MKTVLKVICAWCGNPIREVDGEGVEGVSGGICKKCARKELKRINKSFLSQCLNRIKKLFGHKEIQTLDPPETIQQEQSWIADNPGLHAICVIKGERYVSYLLLPDDLIDIWEACKDTPEMKARWN